MKTLTLANGGRMKMPTVRGGRKSMVIRDKTKYTRKPKHKERFNGSIS